MWTGTAEDQYSQMLYENGKPCWQGGSRSTTVSVYYQTTRKKQTTAYAHSVYLQQGGKG